MAVKLNNAEEYEGMIVKLSRTNFSKCYQQKLEELVEQGLYPTIEDAEKGEGEIEIEIEFYYDKHSGLFAVECGAVESGTIYSPYSGELCEDADIDL